MKFRRSPSIAKGVESAGWADGRISFIVKRAAAVMPLSSEIIIAASKDQCIKTAPCAKRICSIPLQNVGFYVVGTQCIATVCGH
mmetsp:Transcript_45609/g.121269  ORF Transcript_45609/g.121269 Transcript_45609/m.121269 type:complete len:84 (-) Transcript_45609:676-927(-)